MDETTTKKYAYNYLRFSSEQQRKGNSTSRQTKTAEEMCAELGLTLVDTIRDEGVSADKGNNLKANFATLERIVKPGEYVVVEDWDRITRSGREDMFDAIRGLTKKKINVVICDSTCDNELLVITNKNIGSGRVWSAIGAGAGQAEGENNRRKGKLQSAWDDLKANVAQGKVCRLHNLPCWLKNSPKDMGIPHYIVDEEKKKIVNDIFKWVVKGQSSRDIVRLLLTKAIPNIYHNGKVDCKWGKEWTLSQVCFLIRDKQVLGYSRTSNPPALIYPLIVSQDLFEKANKAMDTRWKHHKFSGRTCKDERVNLFRGLCQCVCGNHVNLATTSGDGCKYLHCYSASRDLKCKQKMIRLDRFEASFHQILSHSNLIKTLLEAQEKEEISPSILPILSQRMERYIQQRERLYNIIKLLPEPPSDIHIQIQQSVVEEKKIREDIENENIRLRGVQPVKQIFATSNELFNHNWNDSDCRRQIRDILRDVIEKIEMNGNEQTYKIYFRGCREPYAVKLNAKGYSINNNQCPYDGEEKH